MTDSQATPPPAPQRVTRFDKHNYPLLHQLRAGMCFDDLIDIEPKPIPESDIMDKLSEQFGGDSKQAVDFYSQNRRQLEPYLTAHNAWVDRKTQLGWDWFLYDKSQDRADRHPDFDHALCQIMETPDLPVYFIPQSTNQAIRTASKTLVKKSQDLIPDIKPASGILLSSDMSFDSGRFYHAFHIDPKCLTIVTIVESKTRGMTISSILHWQIDTIVKNRDPNQEQKLNCFLIGNGDVRFDTKNANSVLMSLLFIFFFQVDKVVASQPVPNSKVYQRVKSPDGSKIYDSQLNRPVNIIDAPWFTSVTRADPFLVSGHFRNQPYKNEYKVIWIATFQKNGYTRKSKNADTAQLIVEEHGEPTPTDHAQDQQGVDGTGPATGRTTD